MESYRMAEFRRFRAWNSLNRLNLGKWRYSYHPKTKP